MHDTHAYTDTHTARGVPGYMAGAGGGVMACVHGWRAGYAEGCGRHASSSRHTHTHRLGQNHALSETQEAGRGRRGKVGRVRQARSRMHPLGVRTAGVRCGVVLKCACVWGGEGGCIHLSVPAGLRGPGAGRSSRQRTPSAAGGHPWVAGRGRCCCWRSAGRAKRSCVGNTMGSSHTPTRRRLDDNAGLCPTRVASRRDCANDCAKEPCK